MYKDYVHKLVYKLTGSEFKTPRICPIWKTTNIWHREIKAHYSILLYYSILHVYSWLHLVFEISQSTKTWLSTFEWKIGKVLYFSHILGQQIHDRFESINLGNGNKIDQWLAKSKTRSIDGVIFVM